MRMRGALGENLPDRQGGYACSAMDTYRSTYRGYFMI